MATRQLIAARPRTTTLNEIEQKLVEYLAKVRLEHARRVKQVDTLYGGAVDIGLERNTVQYIGAEIAYCKIMGCYPDLQNGTYRPYDTVRGDGLTVDIKSSTTQNIRLVVKKLDRMELPDLYALMVGTYPTYRLVGHIRADLVIRPERIDHNLKPPAYAVPQRELD